MKSDRYGNQLNYSNTARLPTTKNDKNNPQKRKITPKPQKIPINHKNRTNLQD